MPRLGETMEEGRIVGWIKKPGDPFRRGEILLEIETDKTIVEMPALVDGVLGEILAAEGVQIKVGEPLCRYGGKSALEAERQESGSRAPSQPDRTEGLCPTPPALLSPHWSQNRVALGQPRLLGASHASEGWTSPRYGEQDAGRASRREMLRDISPARRKNQKRWLGVSCPKSPACYSATLL